MKRSLWPVAVVAVASFAFGAETRKSLVDSYAAVADTILDSKRAETAVVRSILESHYHAAARHFQAGEFSDASAEMALFANEGDNDVGGIRKRLLAGGHHHNAEGEEKGVYEPGFVVVTKTAKRDALTASLGLMSAKEAADRKAAWDAFEKVADAFMK